MHLFRHCSDEEKIDVMKRVHGVKVVITTAVYLFVSVLLECIMAFEFGVFNLLKFAEDLKLAMQFVIFLVNCCLLTVYCQGVSCRWISELDCHLLVQNCSLVWLRQVKLTLTVDKLSDNNFFAPLPVTIIL